jgi:hypothetical protein
MEETAKRIGELGCRFGEMVEHMVLRENGKRRPVRMPLGKKQVKMIHFV